MRKRDRIAQRLPGKIAQHQLNYTLQGGKIFRCGAQRALAQLLRQIVYSVVIHIVRQRMHSCAGVQCTRFMIRKIMRRSSEETAWRITKDLRRGEPRAPPTCGSGVPGV